MHCPEEGRIQLSGTAQSPKRGSRGGGRQETCSQDTAPACPHTRSKVRCHLLKGSSSRGVAPHQTRKPGEGQGGDRESANSHAFPLPTSHSQPGRSSKPIQEKPAEQCTLPVPDQRPENPALSTRTNKQACGTERCLRVLRQGRHPREGVPAPRPRTGL